MQANLLSDKILARLTLILILNHTSTHHNPLLRFMLHPTPQPNNLLPEIPRFLIIMIIIREQIMVRMVHGTVTRTTGITRPLIRFTIDLELDLLSGKTSLAAPAFHSLASLAYASAEPAAEVCAVPCAPGPYAPVGCVVAA
jgi:hypothetical protein